MDERETFIVVLLGGILFSATVITLLHWLGMRQRARGRRPGK